MSNTRFDLVILNHSANASIEELVQNSLKLLNKVGDSQLEYKLSEALLFEQNTNAVIEGITAEQGQAYQQKFHQLKIRTELRPTLQLIEKESKAQSGEVYTCPACQHDQPKADTDTMNTCNSCGVVGEKFLLQSKKDSPEAIEHLKREQARIKELELKAARERTRLAEEEKLREEARERLGLTKKNQIVNTVVGISVAAVMGVAIFFITDTIRQSIPDAADIEDNVGTIPTGLDQTLDNPSDNAGVTPAITLQTTAPTKPVTINALGNNAAAANSGQPSAQNAMGQNNGGQGGTINIQGSPTQAGGSTIITHTADNHNQPLAEGSGGAFAEGSGGPKGSTLPSDQVSLTGNHNSATTAPMQLASRRTESVEVIGQLNGRNHAPRSIITGNLSLSFGASDLLEQTDTEEAATLKSLLLTQTAEPAPFFSQDAEDTQTFVEHEKAVQRLLKMNKSDLALVYVEGLNDHYAAAWLTLEVAAFEKTRNPENIQDSPLLTMKSLAAATKGSLQEPLVKANLSQLYSMINDAAAMKSFQEDSLKSLEAVNPHPVDKLYILRLMEATARQFGNLEGSLYYTRALATFAEQVPQDQPLLAGRAYTTLAAIALNQKNHDVALSWAQKVALSPANATLIAELEARKVKALANMESRIQLDPAAASD